MERMKCLLFVFLCSAFGAFGTVSEQVALSNLAIAEQQIARSGHGVIVAADKVKNGVEHSRGKLRPDAIAKVDALMDLLKKKERSIMHSEAAEALHDKSEARSQHSKMSLTQQASLYERQQSATSERAKTAAAKTLREVHMAAGNLHLIEELDQAKKAVANELGKRAPQVEAQVEKYLNEASHAEEHVASDEVSQVRKLVNEAKKAGVTVDELKHTTELSRGKMKKAKGGAKLLNHNKHRKHAVVDKGSSIQDLAGIADKELRSAQLHLHSLKASEAVDRTLVSDMFTKQPLKAKRMQRLLELARLKEKQDVRHEFQQAKRDWRKAVVMESEKVEADRSKKYLRLRHAPIAKKHEGPSVSGKVAALASMADQEARNAHEGLQVARRLEDLNAAIDEALAKPSPRSARKVKRLLKLTQLEQGKRVREELKEASREWKSAIAAEAAELHTRVE